MNKKPYRPLTDSLKSALKRLAKNGGYETFSPDVAKKLVARGLANLTGRKYSRYEYNRRVKGSTLWEVELTGAGRNVLGVLGVAMEKSLAEKLNEWDAAGRPTPANLIAPPPAS